MTDHSRCLKFTKKSDLSNLNYACFLHFTYRSIVICPWGEEGASASDNDGQVVHSPAFPPAIVVDTLGAGDTFNASTIFALSNGHTLKDSITFGCRIAGSKVGVIGWEPLAQMAKTGVLSSVIKSSSNVTDVLRTT